MMTEAELEKYMPWVNFREPIKVSLMDGSKSGWACRYCIGQIGLKGSEFNPMHTMDQFKQHLLDVHGIRAD